MERDIDIKTRKAEKDCAIHATNSLQIGGIEYLGRSNSSQTHVSPDQITSIMQRPLIAVIIKLRHDISVGIKHMKICSKTTLK